MVQYTNLHVIRFKGSSVNRNKFISKVLSIESKVLGPQYCLVFKDSKRACRLRGTLVRITQLCADRSVAVARFVAISTE